MNQESKTNHINISNYILELLSAEDLFQAEQHLSECEICHSGVQEEKAFHDVVKSTISIATKPDMERLKQIRPETSRKEVAWFSNLELNKQFAFAILVIITFIGLIGLNANQIEREWSAPSVTSLSTLSIVTDTPTHVPSQTRSDSEPGISSWTTVEAQQIYSSPNPEMTPAPSAKNLN